MNSLTSEYIGTPGCRTSPGPCGAALNRIGRAHTVGCANKPLDKFVEVDILSRPNGHTGAQTPPPTTRSGAQRRSIGSLRPLRLWPHGLRRLASHTAIRRPSRSTCASRGLCYGAVALATHAPSTVTYGMGQTTKEKRMVAATTSAGR